MTKIKEVFAGVQSGRQPGNGMQAKAAVDIGVSLHTFKYWVKAARKAVLE